MIFTNVNGTTESIIFCIAFGLSAIVVYFFSIMGALEKKPLFINVLLFSLIASLLISLVIGVLADNFFGVIPPLYEYADVWTIAAFGSMALFVGFLRLITRYKMVRVY